MKHHRPGYGTYRYFLRRARYQRLYEERHMPPQSETERLVSSAFVIGIVFTTAILMIFGISLTDSLPIGAVVGGIFALVIFSKIKELKKEEPTEKLIISLSQKLRLGNEVLRVREIYYMGGNPSIKRPEEVRISFCENGLAIAGKTEVWATQLGAIKIKRISSTKLKFCVKGSDGEYNFECCSTKRKGKKIINWFKKYIVQ